MKTKYFLFLIILLFLGRHLSAQSVKYSKVKVDISKRGIVALAKLGVAVDAGEYKKNQFIISDFSEKEISLMRAHGFNCDVIIDDVSSFYQNRNLPENLKNNASKNTDGTGCSVAAGVNIHTPVGFTLGSVGGFYTYDEMVAQLDSLKARYPNLVSIKHALPTTSLEGRNIYWIRISDNAEADEQEPEVLYTALTHAREPQGMQQLFFYMYYLLENYNTDNTIKQLLDNTELYFIPMVNPDGYTYNVTTNPAGGGLWRKNRRNNGNSSFGVDLNRNWGYMWGYDDNGSSPDSTAETYRGTVGFSEPETQAVRDFCNIHSFKLALNYHTYSDVLVIPFGYGVSLHTPDSVLYWEYAKILTKDNHFAYGTPNETVGYTGNGGADDWMYADNTLKPKIISFTPEAGNSTDGFWPASNRIEDIARSYVTQNLSMAQLAGRYAAVHDNTPSMLVSQSGFVKFSIQSLGMDNSGTFTVSIVPVGNAMATVGISKVFSGMQTLEIRNDSIAYSLSSAVLPGDEVKYTITLNNGQYTTTDTLTKYYGQPAILFNDVCSTLNSWTPGNWGVSITVFHSPSGSITDSPTGMYSNLQTKTITQTNAISLANSAFSMLSFWAKWDIENNYDYVELAATKDNGVNWIPLCGKYTNAGTPDQTNGTPIYDGTQSTWVKEEILLSDFIGSNVKFRFKLKSDSYATGDGFYFDDFQILSIPIGTVGIDEKKNTLFLSEPMPNPASDNTIINYSIPAKVSGVNFEIYNTMGELVYTQQISAMGEIILNTTNWKSGLYYYKINGVKENSASRKLLVW